ncbi:MAG: AbrB/MazE/SpoVT family DNA-binding domain-containing protein [Candidatus Moranbacteria bacterium]|nr:AbrB/MazE/SpoVT family DNA-binding domain-containing protein [bacterium]MDP1833687.1 AbrB/MazE/SpoVT family DNA-binding domain-containing protein [Candidatus Moranbacteria bacterium]MDZ4385256.1 AbrB/MazE/SpoVT family DNA-binding domain-containing protein [Candidatus Moranbacteria bacterium]
MQKLKDKNIRKLIRMGRVGSSLGLTLPKEIVTGLGWRGKQKVAVKKFRGGVLIKDWKK